MPVTVGNMDFIRELFGGGTPGKPKEEPKKEIIIEPT